MIELTAQQCKELTCPEPVAVDPGTKWTYVLVRKEAYERLKSLLAMDDYAPGKPEAWYSRRPLLDFSPNFQFS